MTHCARILTVAALLSGSVYGQQIHDPANLTGEQVAAQALADTLPINHGAAALQQLLLKLRTRASMMLIVAHPDDEDGGFLTYESRGQGARVAMLTLTRGEGGQNLMSADFDEALGLIRTQELLAADRYMGVDQFFGTEVDFGFSKTKEESFEKWTHERVLYDAVRCVRLYRPLVIASVFVGEATDGHGHHQVSGEIAQEVFKAAADPNVFPEMIQEGLLPWAAEKVYARVPFSRVGPDGMYDYATGRTIAPRFDNYVTGTWSNSEPKPTVLIHEGDPATVNGRPALGMDGLTYVQFARRGLALQKTQIGPNVRLAPAGRSDTGYTLMGSRVVAAKGSGPEQSIFDGIDVSLPGIASLAMTSPIDVRSGLASIDKDLAEAQGNFDPNHPEAVASSLAAALRKLEGLLSVMDESQFGERYAKANILHELRIKRVQLNNALLLALGVTAEARLEQTDNDLLTTQDKIAVKLAVKNPTSAKLRSASIMSQSTEIASAPLPLEGPAIEIRSNLVHRLPATRPYFSAEPDQFVYKVSNPALRNAPATPAPVVASLRFDYEGSPLELQTVVQSPKSERAAVVVPAFSIMLAPSSGIITPAGQSLMLSAVIDSHSTAASASVGVRAPGNWEVSPPLLRLPAQHPGEHSTKAFTVVPKSYFANQTYELNGSVSDSLQNYREGFRSVGYTGLTYTNLYTPATYKATAVDVTTAPGLKVAYLSGTGDPVPDFLPSLGVTPALITPADLTAEKLKQFDAVLVGVRAYAAQPALAGEGSKPLIEYVRNGGVVILEYMTARFGDAEAPYAISVPGDPSHNVVEEAEPVQVLVPNAPLLTWPNKITAADFDKWVEERGHGFAAAWAPEYTALLETHDAGQDPQRGGLLIAPVGKGAYIYCALAIYRQLPEGVPGAYRLLANLVSYAKNPGRPH